MMKRILSVVLSVIMMLSLIAVPGLAADLEPAPVEYTVSSVTYSAKAVPPSGTFTASVDVTASAPSQASVIYATLQDGAMLSAKYVTKTVGASKETFTVTFDANPAYTYKVFVVETATGKALAPEANFPVHENALAFVEVEYVNGTSEKLPVAEDDEIITILKTPASRVAGNPKFKFIPLDNSSKIEEEGGRNFWEENKKVTLTAADGSKKVYTVEPDTIKLTFKPTVADDYLYENLGGKVQYNPVVEKITAIITGSEVTVDVPAGTSRVTLQSFTHGDVKVNGATINFTGATAKHTFKINGKTYTVNLRWDENTPGIYNVTRNFAKTNRSFFLRANRKALYVQHGLVDADMKNAAAAVAVSTGEKLADDGSAVMNITIPLDTDGDADTPPVDTPLRNDASTLAIVALDAETGNRTYNRADISSLMGSWIKGNTSGEWVKFTPSAAGTVYVRATQADAMTDEYTWNEITNEDGSLKDGWYEVVGAKLNGKTEDFKMFAKNFEAGKEVVIPTQALDGDEYRYVKTTLMNNTEYSLESYTEGSLPQLYKNGSPVEGNYFCRKANMLSTGLKTGYDAFALICFDVELAENYNPALSGADKLDLWYSTAAKIEEPATQSATAANVQSGNSVYTGGIYQVPAKAAKEATVNHTDKTFEITVPYGTEKVTLDIRDGAGQIFANKDYYLIEHANGEIPGVKVVDDSAHLLYAYTGTIKWADFDAEEMSETAPLVYELAYKVSGKENLVGADYYYVMPTRLTLNEEADLVEGTSDLKDDDGIVDLEAGEWLTSQSHNRGNYVALDAGKHYNNLHISGKSFASWVENGTLTDKYALDGATMLVTDYKDAAQDTRFEFKTVKSGYVIAAYATEQSLGGWTRLEGCKIETTRGATTTEKESLSWPPAGHTNAATDFALWADSYDYIYVKKVVANEAVTINETATTQNLPPIVMVTDKEIFPTPSMKTISYKVGDGEATPITFAEGVKTANITVAYTTEAVSVVGEINGTGKAVADKSVTLDYATPSDVITVAIQDVFGETVDTYTINITMDFAAAQAPALETLTYKIGDGTPVALEFDGVTEIDVPVVSYTPDTFYIDATITGNGFVEISDEEFVIEYEDAPDKIETKAVTVIVKNVENETVATYTLNFAMDFNTLVNPTFSKISYKIGDGEPVEIESLTANAATVRFETLISDAVSLVAENEGDGYWVYSDPVTLDENNTSREVTATLYNAIHEEIAKYTITFTIPEKPAISVKFTPVLNNYLAFNGQSDTKQRKTYTEQTKDFVAGPQEYIVTVPYGTESATVAPIATALGTVEGFALDFTGKDFAETSFEIGGFTYDVTFKWEHENPYIYGVTYDASMPQRYIVLRGSDNGYIGYSTSTGNISDTTASVYVTQSLAKAEDSNLSLTVNGKAISKAYSTVFSIGQFDNFVNTNALKNMKNPGKVGWNSTDNWISFKASDAGTVYVQMSHANAKETGFVWPEGEAKGWTKETNVTGTDSAIYSLRFNAGDTVNIPSQLATQAEIDYVNAKLQEAYPVSGAYQFKYVLAAGNGYSAQLHYSNDGKAYDAADKTWTAISAGTKLSDGITLGGTLYMGAYYRCSTTTGLSVTYGYKTFVVVSFDEPADESVAAGALTYKIGDNTPVAVAGEEVEVAYGTTQDITLNLAYTGNGTVEYSPEKLNLSKTTQSGSITATLKDADGAVVETRTVTFRWGAKPAAAITKLYYKVGDSTPVDITGETEVAVSRGATNITLVAEYENGTVEYSPATLTLDEQTPSGSITATLKDLDGEVAEEHTVTFTWSEQEAPVLKKLYYKIGDGEPVEIGSLTANAATVAFEECITGAISLEGTHEGEGYWEYDDPVTLDENNTSGEVTATLYNANHEEIAKYTITFTIPEKPAISVKFTPVLNNYLAFNGDGATKNRVQSTEQTKDFEEGPQEYIVTVPYGTESATVAPIATALGTVEGFALDFTGKDFAETSFEIGGFTYDVTFKWEHDKPYIYNVSYQGVMPKRYIVLRGSDNGYIGYSTSAGSNISDETASVSVDQQLAWNTHENLSLTVNGKAISKAYSTVFTLSRFDNFVRAEALTNLTNPGKVGWNPTDNWISFKASDAGTVYVQMSHANAKETGFVWPEGEAKGWTKETNVTGTDSAIYSLRFNAGDTVNIPSQLATQAEIDYVNAKLQEAYPVSGAYQFKYVLAAGNGYSAQLQYSNDGKAYDAADKTWTAISAGTKLKDGITLDGTLYMGAYYRCANNTGLSVTYGYKTFVVVSFDEPAPARLNDLEDGGLVAAVEADSVNTTQETGSTDITVSGSDANYKNEVVAVYVLADGKSMSDLTAALAGGSGNLDGIILAMGKAWADEDGNFTVDLTLPEGAGTDDYNVGIVTEEATAATIEYVGIVDQITAYNAIVNAARNDGDMAAAFETVLNEKTHIEMIVNIFDIYNSLGADKAVIQASVKADTAVKALPVINAGSYTESDIANIAKLAEIIDARVAIEVFNNGDNTQFDALKGYILNDASLTEDALAIFEGDAINAIGKPKVLEAITSKNFEVTAGATIQQKVSAAFSEAVFVNMVNKSAYTNASSVLPLVEKFDDAGVLVGTNGVAMNEVTLTALSEIMKGTDITGYTDFADRVNVLTAPAGEQEPPAPGAESGGVTNGTTPPVGPTTKLLSSFADANDAPWAAAALQTMLDRNILSGYEDNTIRPNNSATRQEVAKMLVEAFSAVRPYAWTGFSDVPAGSWYYSYVATAAEDGIIKGMGDGKFGTDANITREDLSVLIYRFLVNKGIAMNGASMRAFTDAVNMSNYATEAIHALTNAGIVNGYTDGSYNPKGNATRAEIAQIIANVIVTYAL